MAPKKPVRAKGRKSVARAKAARKSAVRSARKAPRVAYGKGGKPGASETPGGGIIEI